MTRQGRRAVVTGVGAITPVGCDAPSTWASLSAGRSGVRRIDDEWAATFPVQIAATVTAEPTGMMDRVEARRMDRCEQFALIAAREAWQAAGAPDVPGERLAVVISTGVGGMLTTINSYDTFREKGWQRLSPFTVPMLMPNGAAGWVGLKFGAQAGVHAAVSACASGAEAIGHAADIIRYGRADVVIAGGTEAAIHPAILAGFAAMRALSKRNDEPESASRPFDAGRDGFVFGEGAGIVVLEAADHARARGADVHAEVAGVGYSGDAYDIAAPEPTGSGQVMAMRRALADADVAPRDVVHINAHATSTLQGDVIEAAAIRKAFGANADAVAVSATKSMTGHMLGGAGAVESIAVILALSERSAPPTINVDDLDKEIDLDVVRDRPRPLPDGGLCGLNNSFGFGGHNVSILFRRN
jgi:3-oxoacyl-[acyl-carrier-protein] synthase II